MSLTKKTAKEARAFELFVKHFRLAVRHWRLHERKQAAAERERDKWRRSGRCPTCKGAAHESNT